MGTGNRSASFDVSSSILRWTSAFNYVSVFIGDGKLRFIGIVEQSEHPKVFVMRNRIVFMRVALGAPIVNPNHTVPVVAVRSTMAW